jgi:hypothetical protein
VVKLKKEAERQRSKGSKPASLFKPKVPERRSPECVTNMFWSQVRFTCGLCYRLHVRIRVTDWRGKEWNKVAILIDCATRDLPTRVNPVSYY